MPSLIESPTNCEVRAVISFLTAKDLETIGIHNEISTVYDENI